MLASLQHAKALGMANGLMQQHVELGLVSVLEKEKVAAKRQGALQWAGVSPLSSPPYPNPFLKQHTWGSSRTLKHVWLVGRRSESAPCLATINLSLPRPPTGARSVPVVNWRSLRFSSAAAAGWVSRVSRGRATTQQHETATAAAVRTGHAVDSLPEPPDDGRFRAVTAVIFRHLAHGALC